MRQREICENQEVHQQEENQPHVYSQPWLVCEPKRM